MEADVSAIRTLLRFPSMWSALTRVAVLIGSILVFDLSPRAAVVLYVFEAWVCLSLRLGLREPAQGGGASPTRPSAPRIAGRALVSALFSAPILAMPALLICDVLFGSETLSRLLDHLALERGLLASAITVLAVELIDAMRMLRRMRAGAGGAPDAFFVLARAWVLILPAMALAELRLPAGIEGWLMLLAMIGCILLFEGLPVNELRRLGKALESADSTREP
jgi:hypothetical protein